MIPQGGPTFVKNKTYMWRDGAGNALEGRRVPPGAEDHIKAMDTIYGTRSEQSRYHATKNLSWAWLTLL